MDLSQTELKSAGRQTIYYCSGLQKYVLQNQWYIGECLTTGLLKQDKNKDISVAFVSFYGVNTPTLSDFKLSR